MYWARSGAGSTAGDGDASAGPWPRAEHGEDAQVRRAIQRRRCLSKRVFVLGDVGPRVHRGVRGCRLMLWAGHWRGGVHVPIDRRPAPTCHSLMLLPRILRRSHAIAAAYVAAKPPFSSTRHLHASAALRAIDMAKVDTSHRLAELRKLMKERNVDIYSTPAPPAPNKAANGSLTLCSGALRRQPSERVHCPV